MTAALRFLGLSLEARIGRLRKLLGLVDAAP
jgi:hypothetical protein